MNRKGSIVVAAAAAGILIAGATASELARGPVRT